MCLQLTGHFLDVRVTFTVELRQVQAGQSEVWFSVQSSSKKAAKAYTLTNMYRKR
jgi:hypothetical protein